MKKLIIFIMSVFIMFPVIAQENAMIIDQNGNVGIGTDTPLSNLNIHSSGETWIDITSDAAPNLRWALQLKTGWI